jgi:ribosomal protein S18 acetylase RimI-like enzyme
MAAASMTADVDVALLPAQPSAGDLADLADLLIDVVDHGAAVHFVPPLARDLADGFWADCIASANAGKRCILVARDRANGRILGSVQLVIDTPANQQHRADVSKLLVHSHARRRGIARQLMLALERHAALLQRTLLTLDTRAGDAGEALYRQLGYVVVGSIPGYSRDITGDFSASVYFYKQVR